MKKKAPASHTLRRAAAREDFHLSKEHSLPVIAPLDENGIYLDGFAWLTGSHVPTWPPIFDSLRAKNVLYRTQRYSHRYPTCWRCGEELDLPPGG
ncbi:hypothetical protein [Candidatus Amarobacter glycogenicus]|uniref:hypothetical protein n=1 Tax=Candidatus Amarobacter glycogenicus TaxID=3140699 RepID=UPI0031364AE5|nr:class I tRNA ligase family protein [Dehalococcoidia bacterium]